MASYGIPPQLYPYLYAPPKASTLGLHSSPSSLDSSDLIQNLRHRKSGNQKEYESDEKNNEEIMSTKEGDDENLDENENVEID